MNSKKYTSNSTVGVMIKAIGSLNRAELKGISLALTAFCGNNVCMNFK